MRHLLGFVLGAVLAPTIIAVTGWALPRLTEIAGFGNTFVSFTGVVSVGVLAALALIVGFCVAAPRLSPLAPGLCAVVLLGWSLAYALRSEMAVSFLPATDWGQGAGQLLALGLYVPVAAALFVPLLLASRWRGQPAEEPEEEEYLEDLYEEEASQPERQEHHEGAPRRGRHYAGRRRARG